MLAPPMDLLRPIRLPLAVMLLALAGCASKGAKSSMPTDSMMPAPLKTTEADGYEGQLRDYESQLRAAGVELGDKRAEEGAVSQDGVTEPEGAGATPMANDEGDRCQRVCDLADAICDLKDQVCDLAARHPDEPHYGQVCERATEDCEVATNACEGCDDA